MCLKIETQIGMVCAAKRYLITGFSTVDFNVYDLKRECLICSHAENIDIAKDLSMRIEINRKKSFVAV